MKERLVAGLDLGSSAIRLAVGQINTGADRRQSLTLIGASEVPSQGIARGAVKSLEDAVSAISECLELAERQIGLPISEVHVGLGGIMMQVVPSKGVVGVSRPDGEIREEDARRVLDSARSVVNPANYEILHTLPTRFTVDGQSGIKDPVGMQGIRLEADVFIIQGLSSHVRNLAKAVVRTNLEVGSLVYAPLAAAEAVLTDRQRELGAALVNIGASTTSLVVYEEGDLLHSIVLPLGADHITSDIAIGLRTSLEVAENCKRHYVSALPEVINREDTIDLFDVGAQDHELAAPRFMSDIAFARVEEIFEKIEIELSKIERSGLLPSGVVLTGGGSKLHGIADVGKSCLRLPVCVSGVPNIQSPIAETALDPSFSTAIGVMLWGFEAERGAASRGGSSAPQIGKKLLSPLTKIFKSFVP